MGENRVHPGAAEQPVSTLLGADCEAALRVAGQVSYLEARGYDRLGDVLFSDLKRLIDRALIGTDAYPQKIAEILSRLDFVLEADRGTRILTYRYRSNGRGTNFPISITVDDLREILWAIQASLSGPADGPLGGQDGQLRDEHSTVLPTPPSEGGAS